MNKKVEVPLWIYLFMMITFALVSVSYVADLIQGPQKINIHIIQDGDIKR